MILNFISPNNGAYGVPTMFFEWDEGRTGLLGCPRGARCPVPGPPRLPPRCPVPGAPIRCRGPPRLPPRCPVPGAKSVSRFRFACNNDVSVRNLRADFVSHVIMLCAGAKSASRFRFACNNDVIVSKKHAVWGLRRCHFVRFYKCY